MYTFVIDNAKLNIESAHNKSEVGCGSTINVLEVGCGYGNHYDIWQNILNKNTPISLTAIDINKDAVDKLNQPNTLIK